MKLKHLVCFRVDGGAKLGMGHLFKSLILANALKKQIRDAGILFLIKEDGLGISWLKKNGSRFLTIPKRINRSNEPQWMIQNIPAADKVLFAIDILDVSKKYVLDLKRSGFKVITFENKNESRFEADVTVNAIVKGLKNRVTKQNGCVELQGAKFRVFHPDYLSSRRSVKNGGGKTVLITMGGGADKGFTKSLVQKIAQKSEKLNLIVVQGPAQEKLSQSGAYKLIGPQKSLAPWLQKADLAVTAGGGTLYELALTGVPGIAFSKVNHQVKNIKMFEKAGSVIYGGSVVSANAARAANQVIELFRNKSRRQKMTRAGRKIVDGLGTQRIVKQMLDLLKGE